MPDLAPQRLAGTGAEPVLLVVGPSLGTPVAALWSAVAPDLGVEVVGWDLPGHGAAPPARAPFDVVDPADTVAALASARAQGRPVHYAGVSLGGAVGFELALRSRPFSSVASRCSAPRIGEPAAWRDRAGLVRGAGTGAVVDGSRQRWFARGFVEREPAVADALLDGLRATDAESYALACEALARFDLRGRTADARVPLLAVTGAQDVVVGAEQVRRDLPGAEHAELPGCGHLPPAEQPAAVVALLQDWTARAGGAP